MAKVKMMNGIEYVKEPTDDNLGCAVWGCTKPFYKFSPESRGTPVALCKEHYHSY